MFTKLMDWWNKGKAEKHFNDFREVENEQEWKFETTLVEDLDAIADLLCGEFPEHILIKDYGQFRRVDSKINFSTEKFGVASVHNIIPLQSLRVEQEIYDSIWWSAEYTEYRNFYDNQYSSYAIVVRALRDSVKYNYNNTAYHYIFNKYEDSIHIVLGALKDEKENNNGEISEEVFQKAKLIIDKFGRAVKEKQQEIKHVEELQKEAVSKSLIGRLDSEIEYMEKYLETDLYGKETIV